MVNVTVVCLLLLSIVACQNNNGIDAYSEGDLDRAFDYFISEAESGYIQSKIKLIEMYENDEIAENNKNKAVEWFLGEAGAGDPTAQVVLASMYGKGYGVIQKDKDNEYEWLTKAANKGYSFAQFKLAMASIMTEDASSLARFDQEKIIKKSAEQGHYSAQSVLGVLYTNEDRLLGPDYKEGKRWLIKAAEQGKGEWGLFPPFVLLGDLYAKGPGDIPKNYVMSYMWYSIAPMADSSSEVWLFGTGNEARKKRDAIELKMTPDQVAEAQKLASSWMSSHGSLDKSLHLRKWYSSN